jgi:hypothetical protein
MYSVYFRSRLPLAKVNDEHPQIRNSPRLKSVEHDTDNLTLDEFFAFLSHLDCAQCPGINSSQKGPYTTQGYITCPVRDPKTDINTKCFHVYLGIISDPHGIPDFDRTTCSIQILHYCPNQNCFTPYYDGNKVIKRAFKIERSERQDNRNLTKFREKKDDRTVITKK